ncbi:early activation antigen CD69 isoform X2 [Eleginops maclovinus]|uniref:early activation antigen CD69 isoform X2 n=1 Tax=Eleginops maclovinus TaxID=56733 RepID=UPI00308106DD
MYIKFCSIYGQDKKDGAGENLSPESNLSVELHDEKGKQTKGNARLYRAGCLFLTIICLVLLLVVIILSMKLQTGSTICPGRNEAVERRPSDSTCSHEECQALFPKMQPKLSDCKQCANGWLRFGQSCFYLSSFRLSWDESQRNCSSRGGSLAVVTSRKLQNFLTKEGQMSYWIGLRHRGDKWTWVNDNVLTESYWADGKSAGDCGILTSDKPPENNWGKVSCEDYTYFICQM